MKIQFLLIWALSAILGRVSAQSMQDVINAANFRTGVEPYCNEVCPAGYEYIEALGHCYRILLDLGPTSQDRGVEACGFAGGYLPGLDNKHDEDIIRTYFWDKYSEEILAHPNYLENSGFWTAYLRQASDGYEHPYGFRLEYSNLYTGEKMPKEYWRTGQPSNENLDQACVARKWFWIEWFRNNTSGKKNGLDDYVCAFPHWVICQVRKEFALNKRGANLEVIGDVQDGLVDGARANCEQSWAEQNKDQFDIMVANVKANRPEKKQGKFIKMFNKAERHIKSPSYGKLTEALNQ